MPDIPNKLYCPSRWRYHCTTYCISVLNIASLWTGSSWTSQISISYGIILWAFSVYFLACSASSSDPSVHYSICCFGAASVFLGFLGVAVHRERREFLLDGRLWHFLKSVDRATPGSGSLRGNQSMRYLTWSMRSDNPRSADHKEYGGGGLSLLSCVSLLALTAAVVVP